MPITNSAITSANQGETAFAKYIAIVWQVIIIIGGLAVLINILWGALNWIMSGSNPDRLKRAKDQMFNGIFGLAVLVLSYLIIKVVSTVTGLDILNPKWPTIS